VPTQQWQPHDPLLRSQVLSWKDFQSDHHNIDVQTAFDNCSWLLQPQLDLSINFKRFSSNHWLHWRVGYSKIAQLFPREADHFEVEINWPLHLCIQLILEKFAHHGPKWGGTRSDWQPFEIPNVAPCFWPPHASASDRWSLSQGASYHNSKLKRKWLPDKKLDASFSTRCAKQSLSWPGDESAWPAGGSYKPTRRRKTAGTQQTDWSYNRYVAHDKEGREQSHLA